ncbi:MAG: S9 family peptidase, partial [Candidatus Dormibacteraeota bacterium]|nr:S9 family peptidase [Candidatus Dormibacteraeota bacterium]
MPEPIGAEDLYRFRWIDHVRLSHDGERVAYQLSWADAESRQYRSRVVLRRLLEPESIEPTGGPRRDHSPEWSPDGRRLAFISRVGAADQLFVVDVAGGGETRQLTSILEGAAGPSWSPDGSWIAFIGTVLSDPDAVVDDPRPPESKEQVRRVPVARVARRLDYKHDGQGFVDGRYHHLFVVPAAGGNVTQLTQGAWDVTGFDWSPDSARLVVSGNAEPGADLQRELNLYLVDLAGNRQRFGGGLQLSTPAWSPKGDLIAFIAPNGLDAGLLNRLWVVPLTGEAPRCLTATFDEGVDDTVINDMRAGHGVRLCWSAEGDRIYFPASGPGVTGVYSSDLDGNVRQEAGGQRRIFDFDVAAGVVAFAASDPNSPGELHMLTQGAEARLTDLNPWLRDRYIAQPERHQFTAPDGWILEGWVLKPNHLDASKVHPMVMEVHGGPHAQYGWTFFHELQILAGMGYVVLYVNPRGSDGYGERFRREVVRDWGGKDFLDLMSALDQIIERTSYIDTSRMGIGGGSYGGYMTNWVIGQTARFSAAVSMRSISNLVSEYAQHDIVLWGGLELGAPPYPDPDELWKRSPIRYVRNIRTPLLLTCGEMDVRCAISQSEELFGAMRLLGKTVEMVRFPEESHDLSRSGRPDRRVERLRRIAGWYERFLGTAATDRVQEEETQVLPVAAFAPSEAPEPQPQLEPVIASE